MIRIAIMQGSNVYSAQEISLALEQAGMQSHVILWDEPETSLADFQGYVLIDGFSSARNPFMQQIKEQSALGKPILGIGKGAQILVETGLVPGLEGSQIGMALSDSEPIQIMDITAHVRLSKGYQWNAFTRCLKPGAILSVPLDLLAKGRFIISPVLLAEIERNGLHVLQYCDKKGAIVDEYPVNPYGSIHNIAAISNKAGNVMGTVPHLERATGHEVIFQSMRQYIAQGHPAQPLVLDYQPRVWNF